MHFFNHCWQRSQRLFKDDGPTNESFLFANHFAVLYPRRLLLKRVCDVSQADFQQNMDWFYKFKAGLCDQIGQLMLFHQLLGTKKFVLVFQKCVDLNTGELISCSKFNWNLPWNQETYTDFVAYGLYTQEILTNSYQSLKGDQKPQRLRVAIDKYTLNLLKPHYVIGNVSC